MPEVMPPAAASAMTSEDELCLLLARGQLLPKLRTRVREILAAPLQWPQVLERAYSHQVYPLLYRNLRDLGFLGVPAPVQAELKALFMANALRNQLLADELARLLALLGAAEIRVVPLKGVPLAQSLYGDMAARVCADIDILVPPANVNQAIEIILAAGYRTEVTDPYFAKLVLRHGRHFNAVRDGKGASFLVELHWELVQHSSRDTDAVQDLWAEARPQEIFGVPASALTPQWEFLYLCIHAADHDWQCLKWLVDIHELASSGLVDWPCTTKKAEQFELGAVLHQTLAVSSLLLGTRVPANISRSRLPDRLRIFPLAPLPEASPEASLAFRHLRVLRRPINKLSYFATIIFAPKPTDLEFVRLPRHLGFLYYFMRPLRLAWKWAGRALGNTHAQHPR